MCASIVLVAPFVQDAGHIGAAEPEAHCRPHRCS